MSHTILQEISHNYFSSLFTFPLTPIPTRDYDALTVRHTPNASSTSRALGVSAQSNLMEETLMNTPKLPERYTTIHTWFERDRQHVELNAQDIQYERIMAYSHGELIANCEDCGASIPVELSKCDACAPRGYDTCDECGTD